MHFVSSGTQNHYYSIPFDEQRCQLKFESKTHESRELNVSATGAHSYEDALYESNGEWSLIGNGPLTL